jgi:hypothetical protein
MGAAQALRLVNLPMGFLRPIPQPFQPLVQDGLLRQSPEGQALQGASEDILIRKPAALSLSA